MSALILSGVGGSTNWLPLIFPLVAVVVVAYSVDFIIKYVKKRKALREQQIADDLAGHFKDSGSTSHNI
jgi:hypothetical protein